MITQIVQVCLIPLLGILIKYVANYLTVKTNNALVEKYTSMINATVESCVIATNQTYVNSLKNQGIFDSEAQQEAFNKTIESILTILSEDVQEYITEMTGDITIYLTTLIEEEVNKCKS